MIYDQVSGIREPLKQDLALEFCRNQNNDINILTETHINNDQNTMKEIIGWIPSFSLLEIACLASSGSREVCVLLGYSL